MYPFTPSIHRLPSIARYAKCPLFLLLLRIPINAFVCTYKNSNAYNSSCAIDIALKLLTVAS